ncbi:MAG: hypothetical protein R3C14_24280 [Caldilineaceae bacterium]
MKTSPYFERRVTLDRPDIRREWCERVVRNYIRRQRQKDGRIRYWGYIEERHWGYIEERRMYLRVVVLEDGVTLHNAFFDRDFKE